MVPDYDPFWAAAQDLNMPLSLHILTGRKGMGVDFFSDNIVLQASTLPIRSNVRLPYSFWAECSNAFLA
jgi:hypothetical protein